MSTEPPLPVVSHIVSLESQNVKRLKAVRIEPKGNALVIIGGANEAGKSSVLDSIAMVLGGRAEMPAVPVRKGQKRAHVICDLGSIIVKRTLTKEGGGQLTIEGSDGHKFTSPQTLLEQLTGKIAFDPVSFMRLDALKQADTLRQLVGLDFGPINAEIENVYTARTEVNRDVTRLKGLHGSLPRYESVPEAEVSSADVLKSIDDAQAKNNECDAAEAAAKRAEESSKTVESNRRAQETRYNNAADATKIAQANHEHALLKVASAKEVVPKDPKIDLAPLEADLAALMAKIKAAHAHNKLVDDAQSAVVAGEREEKQACDQVIQARRTEIAEKSELDAHDEKLSQANAAAETARAATTQGRIDLGLLRSQLAGVEETNRKVRANVQKTEALKSLRAAEGKSETMSQQLEDLAAKKQELLAAAKFPVTGLGFNEDGVTFNELPLNQASSAQQLRISVAIAASMNPKLRVMLVRDGSLLDDANLALLKELCVSFNLQCWVERVGHGAECSVVIADGEVEGAESTATEEEEKS